MKAWLGTLSRASVALLGLIAGAVLTLLVTTYGPDVLDRLFGQTASLSEQLDAIAHDAAKDDYC